MAGVASTVYGLALFELAGEKGKLEELYPQVVTVRDSIVQNPEIISLFDNPQVTVSEKKEIVEKIFKGRVDDMITGCIITAVEKRRYDDIIPLLEYYISAYKEEKHIGILHVTSAYELDADTKKKIENRIISVTDYVSLEADYTVDKSIIGGLVLRIGDRVVDSSIKRSLEELKTGLMEKSISNAAAE